MMKMKLNDKMIQWLNEPLNDQEIELAKIRCNEFQPLKNITIPDLFDQLKFMKPFLTRLDG
jgi:hypothetical protein